MRIIILISFSAFLVMVTAFTKTVDDNKHSYILRISPDMSLSQVDQTIPDLQFSNTKQISKRLGIYATDVLSSLSYDEVKELLYSSHLIATVGDNHPIELRDSIPNDGLWEFNQGNMRLIRAPQAWSTTTGGFTANGDEVVVGIIDDGFDLNHVDLQGNIWVNNGEIPGDGIDNDGNGYIDDINGLTSDTKLGLKTSTKSHGTGTMGTIAAKGNNVEGIAGVMWNVKIMGVAPSGDDFKVVDILEGYEYFLTNRRLYNETDGEKGAYIVSTNSSLGIPGIFAEDQPEWCAYFDRLNEVGILNVGATDNRPLDIDVNGDMPSDCPSDNLIIVTDTDLRDQLSAAIGPIGVDLSAPGDGTYTLAPEDQYNNLGGTSSAAPHVAAAIALAYTIDCSEVGALIKDDPQAFNARLKTIMLETTDPLADLATRSVSGGRLNLGAFIEQVTSFCEEGDSRSEYFINSVTPNPTDGEAVIEYTSPDLNSVCIALYTASGQKMMEFVDTPTSSGIREINVDLTVPSGQYYLSIPCDDPVHSLGLQVR